MELTCEDREALRRAVLLLENPGFAAKLANAVGQPFERVIASLPANVSVPVQDAVTAAIRKALDVAVTSIERQPGTGVSDRELKVLAGFTGSIGGFFGLPAMAIELPVTTTVMMRSIADIARREGEDLYDPAVKLACLEVFALGGRTAQDEATETGYYAVRAVLARAVSEAAKYIAERGVAGETAPVIVRLIATIASRFGIVVSHKMAAAAVPVIGALGGATINVIFLDHFQNMAHGHFAVRRLERAYGADSIRAEYERIREELSGSHLPGAVPRTAE